MSQGSVITLCVQLWPIHGQEAGLIEFEDRVLALIPNHGGRVLQRVRSLEHGDAAFETQIVSFPDERSMQAYLEDPARLELSALRDRSIQRTIVTPVEAIE